MNAIVAPGYHVADVQRSLKFYRDILGMQVRMQYGPADKPDVVMPISSMHLSNEQQTIGSSNSTGILAGIVAVLKAEQLNFGSKELRRYIKTLDSDRRRGAKACGTHRVWRTPSPRELRDIVAE